MEIEEKGATHTVTIKVEAGKITCVPCCVHVDRGDKIKWEVFGRGPVAIIIKEFVPPLCEGVMFCQAGKGTIEATVVFNASSGFHPYSVVAYDGRGLLVNDPEIIVKPPKGGR